MSILIFVIYLSLTSSSNLMVARWQMLLLDSLKFVMFRKPLNFFQIGDVLSLVINLLTKR